MRHRIAIVTFHRAYNYGAVLQAYSLNRYLRDNGADCELLDYYPEYFYNMYHVLPQDRRSLPGLKTLCCHMLLQSTLSKRNKGFERFLKQYTKISDRSYSNLKSVELPYDAFIAGSDQIWSPSAARFDPAFFLSSKPFAEKLKYSYAASFGTKYIPEELRKAYQKRLGSFRRISVREESGVPIVESLTGKSPIVSCDPTLLLEKNEWDEICGEEPIIKGEYIFLYYVKQPKDIRLYAEKLASDLKCKVVCLSCYFVKSNKLMYDYMSGKIDEGPGFISYNTASPNEFLNLIKYAKYVLTSSFHGTVFSILFHKQFLTQTIWGDGSVNERVINLLDQVGLSKRSINNKTNDIDEVENWKLVDQMVSDMRSGGVQYLRTVLDDIGLLS